MALTTKLKASARALNSISSPHTLKAFYAYRTMSTKSPAKIDWLVIVNDHDGVLAKRMEIRPTHFENLKPSVEAGFWKMGGAMLDHPPAEGEGLAIMGSCMIAHAATKEEILEVLKKDVYAKEVWDLEKVQIYPYKTAFRNP